MRKSMGFFKSYLFSLFSKLPCSSPITFCLCTCIHQRAASLSHPIQTSFEAQCHSDEQCSIPSSTLHLAGWCNKDFLHYEASRLWRKVEVSARRLRPCPRSELGNLPLQETSAHGPLVELAPSQQAHREIYSTQALTTKSSTPSRINPWSTSKTHPVRSLASRSRRVLLLSRR